MILRERVELLFHNLVHFQLSYHVNAKPTYFHIYSTACVHTEASCWSASPHSTRNARQIRAYPQGSGIKMKPPYRD